MSTPIELRLDAERLEELLRQPTVKEAMRARCESTGHEWVNCCSAMFQVYSRCEWCGVIR